MNDSWKAERPTYYCNFSRIFLSTENIREFDITKISWLLNAWKLAWNTMKFRKVKFFTYIFSAYHKIARNITKLLQSLAFKRNSISNDLEWFRISNFVNFEFELIEFIQFIRKVRFHGVGALFVHIRKFCKCIIISFDSGCWRIAKRSSAWPILTSH